MTFSLPVFIRTLIAIFGCYAVGISASFGMIPVSLWLFTNNPHDAVFIGLMCSYLFAFIAFIISFCCQNNIKAAQSTMAFCLTFLSIYTLFPVEQVS